MITVANDSALFTGCWRSIGLRSATVEWEFSAPVMPAGSLAMRLRSALGPALAATGARAGTLVSIPGDVRPPALWFRGWDCPVRPVRRLIAGLRCVGAVGDDWPALHQALRRVRLPAAHGGRLVDTVRCSVVWHDGGGGEAFGPPLLDGVELALAGGSCLVETLSPLHLTAGGRIVTGPPPLPVLVRSAGERVRQLALHWGAGADALPTAVGQAYREGQAGRLAWAEMAGSVATSRRSSSTGQEQVIRGVRGVFAYDAVSPLAMTVLALGAEVSVGKDTAFGCGQLRISVAAS
jgi:hypothetical protein